MQLHSNKGVNPIVNLPMTLGCNNTGPVKLRACVVVQNKIRSIAVVSHIQAGRHAGY
jgi:hypothetical protein